MNQPSKAPSPDDIGLSYDEMPYESYCFRVTHPDHMHTIGSLFGLTPPDFKTARVLELGCAMGGNLFPFAHKFPEAHCTGIDLSGEQIKQATHIQKELGLRNVEFLQKDIMDIDADFGTFDYIIAHGVFSWVPDHVRDHILEICRENLSENGIAFISYNTYPGWHFVTPVRDVIGHHTKAIQKPAEKVQQARHILDFMVDNIKPDQSIFRHYLTQENNVIKQRNDSYVYHEFMEAINQPFYFHEFNNMLEDRDLQYIGDADLSVMYIKNVDAAAMDMLATIKDPVKQEQYLDFFTNCRFRKSLITRKPCHLNRQVNPERVFEFYLSSKVLPVHPGADVNGTVEFKRKEGAGGFQAKNSAVNAFFLALCDLDQSPVTIDDIAKKIKEKFGMDIAEQVNKIALAFGVDYAMRGFIELHAAGADFVTDISEKPCVYPVARQEIHALEYCRQVTNTARSTVPIQDSFFSRLMIYCDGTRDKAALVNEMAEEAAAGRVVIRGDRGQPLSEGQYTKDNIEMMVSMALGMFAGLALLVD